MCKVFSCVGCGWQSRLLRTLKSLLSLTFLYLFERKWKFSCFLCLCKDHENLNKLQLEATLCTLSVVCVLLRFMKKIKDFYEDNKSHLSRVQFVKTFYINYQFDVIFGKLKNPLRWNKSLLLLLIISIWSFPQIQTLFSDRI